MKQTMTIAAALLAAAIQAHAQDIMQTEKWEMQISESGHMSRLVFKDKEKNDTIPFFGTAGKAGPSFYVRSGGKDTVATWRQAGKRTWTSSLFGIACTLEYMEHTGNPAFKVTMENRSHVTFQPQKAGLKTGIDTYMDKYPDWFGKYFPTMMRNEKTHFYGYLQNPAGHIVAIVSEQPVASWSVDYNLGYMDPSPHWFMGHRIESLNLDLLNALPLPERHPQDLYELSPGEKMEWTISFVDVESSEDLEKRVASAADIPVIRAERTSYVPGETATFSVYGEKPEITVLDRNGENALPASIKNKGCFTEVQVMLPEPGLYTVTAQSGERTAEGILSARHSWKWIFDNARDAVLEYHQKPTSHAESWYGFYTGFIAAKHFPDEEKDRKIREYFDLLFNKLHDTDRMVPLYYESRIQNTSTTIGMLVDKFECYGDTADLMAASRLADWLMEKWQREDGAYHNHGIIYTSVIYVAKSMLELSIAEKKAAAEGNSFAEAGSRHYESAKRAIDQLVASKGNFETEGQMTFEDGMISCSALQIGMLALMQEDEGNRRHYMDAMLEILESHECLAQLHIPDARRRGGTMRFWEAQYDVMMLPNMFNSPHGWSAWRAYATWYAYLLTGEEKWLVQTFNAAGAFSELIDTRTGRLRWAFVVDPYIEAEQTCSIDERYTFSDLSFGNPHPHLYETRHFILGEEYVDMVSNWQTVNTQDNDVHEVFKFMGETVLSNAFIIEREDGSMAGYNCRIEKDGKILTVTADEPQITNLHMNLRHGFTVRFNGSEFKAGKGLGWAEPR